jgi:hypothetical protein
MELGFRSRRFFRCTVFALALVVNGECARATDYVWAGGIGNWTASQWFPNPGYPNSFADSAKIDLDIGSINSTVTLNSNVNLGSLSIRSGDTLQILGGNLALASDMNSNGSLRIGDASNTGSLALTGASVFSGSGITQLGKSGSHLFGQSAQKTETLIIAAGHTLSGSGTLLNLKITNQGRIFADTGAELWIDAIGIDGLLNQGIVEIKDGGYIQLNTALVGGSLLSGIGGRIGGVGAIDGATIGGTLSVDYDATIALRNTVQVNDTLQVGNALTSGALRIAGNATLAGPGRTVMANPVAQVFGETSNKTETLTIAADHTLRGTGSIYNVGIKNQGRIVSDGSSGLLIDIRGSSGFLNQGVLEISNDSRLRVYGAIAGGEIKGGVGARITGELTLDGVKLTGTLTFDQSAQVKTRNTLTVTDTLSVGDANAPASLLLESDTSLSGAGRTVLGNSTSSIAGASGTGSERLTLASGHTLSGSGTLSNMGVVNRGRIEIGPDDVMTFVQTVVNQNLASAVTVVNGSIVGGSFDLRAGTLQGSGTFAGLVSQLGGTIAPGNSVGKLALNGTLVQGEGATLAFDIAGMVPGLQHDWLAIDGDGLLNGQLTAIFGYAAKVGDSFVVLTSTNGNFTGSFDNIVANAGILLSPTYAPNSVTLTVIAVPEPENSLLMLIGIGLLCAVRPGRKREMDGTTVC